MDDIVKNNLMSPFGYFISGDSIIFIINGSDRMGLLNYAHFYGEYGGVRPVISLEKGKFIVML